MNRQSSEMLRYWIKVIAFSCLTTTTMLSDDFLHQLFTSNNQAEIEVEYVCVLLVVNICLWLSGSKSFALAVVGLFAGMQIIQLGHISITGSPLTPYDLSKAWTEQVEICLAIVDAVNRHWYVLVAWGIPYALLTALFLTQLKRVSPAMRWLPIILVLVILGSKPERALRRDMVAFMPGPTRSSLHNSINTFSYYLTRMLGSKVETVVVDYEPYVISDLDNDASLPDNIVILIADSLRYDRLQISGYPRETTPYLATLLKSQNLQLRAGIASSVATGSSLPLFLNAVHEPGNIKEIEAKTANLFRTAKKAGFQTHWISTQESKLLSEVGSQYLDIRTTREDFPVDVERHGDYAVLDILEDIDWQSKNFVFLMLRGVHSPYQDNYQSNESFVEQWPTDGNISRSQRLQNAYDNAILNLDGLIKLAINTIKEKAAGNTVFLVTSDHGQMLGESNQWGHNRLVPAVASIPVVLYQWDRKQTGYALPANEYISHYELSNWIINLLGYELKNPNAIAGIHYFQSDQLYGNNFYQPIIEHNSKLEFCNINQVKNFNPLPECFKSKPMTMASAKENNGRNNADIN